MRVSILKPWWAYPQLGQYVFLNFPSISKWEWHPYTLASSPLETHMEVDIKKLGDHTAKLLETIKTGDFPTVRVDGPYGKVVINPRRYRSLVFVCGGIGVTPMVSMLRWYYLINAPPEVAAKQSVHLAEYIYFLWVVDSRTTYDVFRDTILKCAKISGTPGYPTFVPLIHITREQPDPNVFGLPQQGLFSGRPDMKHILGNVKQNGVPRHAVYCCGPTPLVNATWEAAGELSDDNVQFAFHHETFEF
jgi:ferredoxin-NADP reductase